MSRIPRSQEHLKTAFTAEAASAARCRAYAVRAEHDGLPNLARHWLSLAADKDRLAVELLEASEQVRGMDADLGNAISEERYENEALYPRMIRDVEPAVADVLLKVVTEQKEYLRRLEALRDSYNGAQGDVSLPVEVDRGTAPTAPAS